VPEGVTEKQITEEFGKEGLDKILARGREGGKKVLVLLKVRNLLRERTTKENHHKMRPYQGFLKDPFTGAPGVRRCPKRRLINGECWGVTVCPRVYGEREGAYLTKSNQRFVGRPEACSRF